LSQEFGDQARVYAGAMKEQAIDGEALLELSAANPIAANKLKELVPIVGHRIKLKRRIQGLQLASQVPPSSSASPETPASRCTAPSANPLQPPNVAESVQSWTLEDVCTFVQGLSQEFGDQARVYAGAMKEQAIDGEALLELSSADLEELKVSLEHSSLMLARIQDLPRTRSTTP
jgi:hypothetical protein